MFKHFLKSARRHFLTNKLFTFINVLGLSIGMVVCMLALIYFIHEYSYDKFNSNAPRIFVMSAQSKSGEDTIPMRSMGYKTGPFVQQSIPLVESYVRIFSPFSDVVIEKNTVSEKKKFKEKGFLFADSNLFSFFSFHLKNGNIHSVLSRPYSLVITERIAHKYFGRENPIGKTLLYNHKSAFTITGVASNSPSNSTIVFDFIAPVESLLTMQDSIRLRSDPFEITPGFFTTFLLLRDGQSKKNVEKQVQQIYLHNLRQPALDRYFLVSLPEMHFNETFGDTTSTGYFLIFCLVAGMILLLALANYISLATADSSGRSKEIAFRKVLGANSINIASQFYIESFLYTGVAFVIAFFLFLFVQNYFFNLLDFKIDFSFNFKPLVLLLFILLYAISALLAGFYPSLILSGLQPGTILNGNNVFGSRGGFIRKLFTTFQFTIAMALVVFAITINRQIHFFRYADTGVTTANILMIPIDESAKNNINAYNKDIGAISGVDQTALANYSMFEGHDVITGSNPQKNIKFSFSVLTVNPNFISVLNIKWHYPPQDSNFYAKQNRIIVNEELISKFLLTEHPIGSIFRIGDIVNYRVSGVVKNFVYESLKSKIGAMGLFVRADTAFDWTSGGDGHIFIKFNQHVNLSQLLNSIKKLGEKYSPQMPFSYTFLDDTLQAKYKSEQRLESIVNVCTPLIIFISCLGLFGLMYYNVGQKAKEISIRKVLGAEKGTIIFLVGKGFLKLIAISILIAFPCSWYITNLWLNNFPYRIEMNWETFLITGLSILLISMVTVISLVVRASNISPTKNL